MPNSLAFKMGHRSLLTREIRPLTSQIQRDKHYSL